LVLQEAAEGAEKNIPLITSLRQGSGWQALINADFVGQRACSRSGCNLKQIGIGF
jgi:hypothetical protein